MNKFMDEALTLAQKAFNNNEVPVGCVIVKDDIIIGSGFNMRETLNKISSHAEIDALNDAGKNLGTWKLNGCQMYTTVEPCLMCYGAIIQSRIEKVYVGSIQLDFKKNTYRNYIPKNDIIDCSCLDDRCGELMSQFFINMRGR